MSRKPTRAETRRSALVRRFDALEAMEPRSLITESLGILTAGIGIPAAFAAARPAGTAQASPTRSYAGGSAAKAAAAVARPSPAAAAGGTASVAASSGDSVWVALAARSGGATSASMTIPAANTITVAQPIRPASNSGGGAGGSSHGGSGAVSAPGGAAAPAPPQPGGSAMAANSAALSGAGLASTSPSATNPATPAIHATPTTGKSASPTSSPNAGAGHAPPISQAALTFANFPLYTLDYNEGSVLLPGTTRLATLGGNVDLRAQVENTTVSSYSWNTAGLANATNIAGASTYDLTFQWATSVSTATTNSATLTVTNSAGKTQVQTYNFQVPAGSGTAGTGTAAWPQSLSPDAISPGAPAIGGHDVAVDANSGSLDTSIALPAYNPNVPAVVLAYDSVTANPQPIIVEHHALAPSMTTPSEVSAQLTFNGSSGSTYYYNTSTLTPAISSRSPSRPPSAPATGRYAYSLAIGDIRSSTTTTTVTGSTDVVNYSAAAFGAGWTLAGLEKITPATGGVILDLGGGGKSLWFATGSGSTYTDPAGEFSALVANSGGTYTRTLTDGTAIQFNASGQEVADVSTNGVALTYGYDGSGRLSTILDHYGNTTTFSYNGTSGLLQTITDPASRVATFAHSGSAISGVTLPDGSTWGYASTSSGQITKVTDPNGKVVTVAYDSAGRVGTITNPDATSDSFVAAQERGFVAPGSGTSSSPAAPTLLAEDRSGVIDPLGNETDTYPDWQGLGLVDTTSDPLGNATTADRDGNGLAHDQPATRSTTASPWTPTTAQANVTLDHLPRRHHAPRPPTTTLAEPLTRRRTRSWATSPPTPTTRTATRRRSTDAQGNSAGDHGATPTGSSTGQLLTTPEPADQPRDRFRRRRRHRCQSHQGRADDRHGRRRSSSASRHGHSSNSTRRLQTCTRRGVRRALSTATRPASLTTATGDRSTLDRPCPGGAWTTMDLRPDEPPEDRHQDANNNTTTYGLRQRRQPHHRHRRVEPHARRPPTTR